MNLYEKIIELRSQVNKMKKDSKGQNHEYISEDSIIDAIKPKMDELKILLKPTIVPNTFKTREFEYTNSKGIIKKDIIIEAEMEYEWIDADTGEKDITHFAMTGQQSESSQAFGSALTYSDRYFLTKYFNISTSADDPDKLRKEKINKEENDNKVIEIYDKIFISQADAIKVVKLSIAELMRKQGIVKQELEIAVKQKTWSELENLNYQQLGMLENQLKTVNSSSNEWHHLYNKNSKIKEVVPVNQQIVYVSSIYRLGQEALKIVGDDEIKRNAIIDDYLDSGVDLTKEIK